MQIETKLKRENGDVYIISISIKLGSYTDNSFDYLVNVSVRYKHKTYPKYLPNHISLYKLKGFEKKKAELINSNNILKYVTIKEINQAKLNAWEFIKPKNT